MPERQIFPMASGEGYGAVIHGNFVRISLGFRGFYASVCAFQMDDNYQFESFDTLDEAVAWAVAAAETHQGQPRPISKTEHWEIRNGYSITVGPNDSGRYKVDVFPMWVDSDHFPVLNDIETFETRDEAIEWCRRAADERSQQNTDYERSILAIRDALEAHSP